MAEPQNLPVAQRATRLAVHSAFWETRPLVTTDCARFLRGLILLPLRRPAHTKKPRGPRKRPNMRITGPRYCEFPTTRFLRLS